ncbi:MAG: hypothetical protein J7J14_02740 [Thermotogaceae bacterium]|nr:hypothetical protein [Thermotogaceae bacterium]
MLEVVLLIFEPIKVIVAVILSLILFLIAYRKKRRRPKDPQEVKRVIVSYFKRKNWEYRELSHGTFMVKKNMRKILFYVDFKMNFNILKEILYEAFLNNVKDVRILSLERTEDVLEATRRINSNVNVHRTKVILKKLEEFERVLR